MRRTPLLVNSLMAAVIFLRSSLLVEGLLLIMSVAAAIIRVSIELGLRSAMNFGVNELP